MNKLHFFSIILVLGIFNWFVVKQKILEPKVHVPQVEIAGKTIQIELADTEKEREQGLSGHNPLLDNEGMFFIFEKPEIYPFWMKDMLFPIDIIWINQDFKVNYIEKNALPESYPKSFSPNDPALYVLEVNAGFSEKNNLKIGETVKFIR